MSRTQANFLGYEAKADHLVVIKDELNRGKAQLEAEVIDLHTTAKHRTADVWHGHLILSRDVPAAQPHGHGQTASWPIPQPTAPTSDAAPT